MSFYLDDDEFEDEIFHADEPDHPEDFESLEFSQLSGFEVKIRGTSSSHTVHTTGACCSFASAPIAIDSSMISYNNQDYDDEVDFHLELKSLEMLSLIKGPEWAARVRDGKDHLSSFDRATNLSLEKQSTAAAKHVGKNFGNHGVDNKNNAHSHNTTIEGNRDMSGEPIEELTIDCTDNEDYFLGSAYDFDMSEESGSQINVRGTPRGFFVVEQLPTDYREKAHSMATTTTTSASVGHTTCDHEEEDEEGEVFIMDM